MRHENKVETPAYLNELFFKNALEDGLRDMQVNIKKVLFTGASGAGENYCSQIFRATVLFTSNKFVYDRELALIIKSIKITPATKFLDELAVFLREKIFYFDVLNKLEIIGDGSKFAAKCLYTIKEPTQTIVFEDLTQHGYKLCSRQKGLNEQHCLLLLRKLAKFHASSMVLLEKDPTVQQDFVTGMLDEHYIRTNPRFANFMSLQLSTLAEEVEKWAGYEKIAKKLHFHCDNIKENLVRTGKAIPGELLVLNHGDLWVNNFMFKYDTQNATKPIDVMFLDFQNSFYGSPGCDINFFLYSSVQLHVLKNRRDNLIKTYYESLRECLENMHSHHIPTLQDIQMEIQARELYGFFSLYSFLPMVAMRKEDSQDITIESMADPIFAKTKWQQMILSNPRTTETIRYALKRFDDIGTFD